ncbi:MAG: AraC family transcriptional regulator [Lachnospiraceae bacterium]|nr:AraC family transcriptional regulator [Lachnospiraceae bacterium]
MQILDIPINQNQMETTRHGSFGFPAAVYSSVLSRNVLGFTNWHWHEEMQLCRVIQGNVRFSVNQKQYLLQTGDGLFVNSGYLHMAKSEGRADGAYLCLNFHPRLLASFHGSVFEEQYVQPNLKNPALEDVLLTKETPWQRNILDGMERVCRLCEEKMSGYELLAISALYALWFELLKNTPCTGGTISRPRFQSNTAVQIIISYINGHYAEALTVGEIAREASLSVSECCRLFKRVTGDTIFSYLQSLRLSRALDLLKEDILSISQIAYETGFCSASYFIEVFKKRMGQTPLQYRKSL